MRQVSVVVVGLGAMGSATLYQLAKRGVPVLGLDRYRLPHRHGSSHGDSRIARLAIGEGAHYTALAMRARSLWRELETRSGLELLRICGGLIISHPAVKAFNHVENFFASTLAMAREFGIPHQLWDASETASRFPQFRLTPDDFAIFEPDTGILFPQACVLAQLGLAADLGAEIHQRERVLHIVPEANGVRVETDVQSYLAGQIVITAGPWIGKLLGKRFAHLFQVFQQRQYHFQPTRGRDEYAPGHFPAFVWERTGEKPAFYGVPLLGAAGVKIATEQYRNACDPDKAPPTLGPSDVDAAFAELVAPHLPGLGRDCGGTNSCLYTVTPDHGFIIDRHPECSRILIASPCSGHGFKHSPAIGEALAECVTQGASSIDLVPFSLARFANDNTRRTTSAQGHGQTSSN